MCCSCSSRKKREEHGQNRPLLQQDGLFVGAVLVGAVGGRRCFLFLGAGVFFLCSSGGVFFAQLRLGTIIAWGLEGEIANIDRKRTGTVYVAELRFESEPRVKCFTIRDKIRVGADVV